VRKISLKAFGPRNKLAQRTPDPTLIGISHNGVFVIDSRLKGSKIVETQHRSYTSNLRFSAVASTTAGYVAVASEKGDIRLYDGVGRDAKVVLPSSGEAITALDVSGDGRWILATCRPYLLLIDVLNKEGKGAGSLGFEKRFGRGSKPHPKRLQLA
jgi:VID27 C-terminal WD40-like domain